MTAIRPIRRRVALAGVLLAILALPACSSWRDGSGYPLLTNRNPNREYVVQRPTYGPDTGKPFFVGGYAGDTYAPLFPRRAMQYEEGVGDRPRPSRRCRWSMVRGIPSEVIDRPLGFPRDLRSRLSTERIRIA